MIRQTVMYPAGDVDGAPATFDHDYYRDVHVPMCTEAFNCTAEIDKGLDGPNIAAVHFFFESMEAVQAAFASPKLGDIMADIANYTNTAPVMQTSEIV